VHELSIKIQQVEPFEQWGLDFVGQVKPLSRKNHKHILVCTDYATKWVQVQSMRAAPAQRVVGFLYKHIITQFGVSRRITSDSAPSWEWGVGPFGILLGGCTTIGLGKTLV